MRRVGRIAGGLMLIVVGGAALLVGVMLSLLRTDRGSEWARRMALSRVNAIIAGELAVGRFSYTGDRVVLNAVIVREPGGQPVLRVGRIEIAFSPLQLFRGRLAVHRVAIDRPELLLRADARGLNLTRALAAREPARQPPAAPPARGQGVQEGGVVIDLARLQLADGVVDYRATSSSGAADSHIRVERLDVEGAARYQLSSGAFTGSVEANAGLRHPLSVPLVLRASGEGRGDERALTLSADVGDSALAATLRTQSATRASGKVSRLHLEPRLVRAFAPNLPLRLPVDITADAVRDGSRVRLDAAVTTAGGTVTAAGGIDLEAARAEDVWVTARNVDLGAVLYGLPRSDLSLSAEADGGGSSWRRLTGRLRLTVPAGRLAGATIGPLALRVEANQGHYRLDPLQFMLPGVTISGRGTASPQHLAATIDLVARDLARTSRVAASFQTLKASAPAIDGHGRLSVRLSGSLTAPEVDVVATFPRLIASDVKTAGLRLAARLPDVHDPTIASGTLAAREAQLAGRNLKNLSARLASSPDGLTASLAVGGSQPLSVKAAGAWGDDRESFRLSAFALRWPQGRWQLAHAAELIFHPDQQAVVDLALQGDGRQQLRADFHKHGQKLRGRITVAGLDLGALPRLLVPPRLELAGLVDAEVQIDGALPIPGGQAKVTVRGGRVGRYRDLALDIEARHRGGRASGQLHARGLGTAIDARFDVPTRWPSRGLRTPITLEVTVPETNLPRVLSALGSPLPSRVAGSAGLTLQVHGTVGDPSLQLAVNTGGLMVDKQVIGDVAMAVAGDTKTPLTVKVDINNRSSPAAVANSVRPPVICTGSLVARTGLSLSALARDLPTVRELARTHFEVEGDLRGIPLATVSRLVEPGLVSGGTASLRLAAEGTALKPTGALNLQIAGVTGPRIPATDARLDAAFGDRDTRLALRVVRAGRALMSASGIFGLPSRRLDDLAAVAAAPLNVRVDIGPVTVHQAGVRSGGEPGRPQTLSAVVRSALSLDGTLGRPELKLTADLTAARLGQTPVGQAHVRVTYAAKRAVGRVEVRSATGGALVLNAQSRADLGYPQVSRGFDATRLPLEASLAADAFDLTWLSGVNEQLEKVGGTLFANLTAGGSVGAPVVKGELEWKDGTMTLTSLGTYRNIHLRAHGDSQSVWIDDLRLESGGGEAHLTANGTRHADDTYRLKADVNMSRFPVYGQGQALAFVSLDASATASASSRELHSTVSVDEAHIELTDAKQKDLQPLQRPADVILMEGDEPLNRAEARKLEALPPQLGLGALDKDDSGRGRADDDDGGGLFQVRVDLQAPRNLWVKGKDASLELGLGSDFRVEMAGEPRIFGKVIVRRGRIDLLGRRFDVVAGSSLQFVGPPDAPRLDLAAKHVNERENITVLLKVSGTLDRLTIAVTSPDRPDLTEGQLYTLIATGRLQLGGSGAGSSASASSQAASLLGGVLASQLQKALSSKLPLDVLSLQFGDGLSGSRLEAGTYLTDKLYAGYVGRVGANPALLQNRNAVHLEYQLTRRWSFDGEYGDLGTATVDLMWTKNY